MKRYQATADCPVQFDFWWLEGFQRLGIISASDGAAIIGTASR